MSRTPLLFLCVAAGLLPLACTAQTTSVATPPPTAPTTSEESPAGTGANTPGKITYSACHVEGPYIAMTYDDGPHAQNTPRLLDMLKERKIHATFFMCGENAIQYPQIIKRMVAEGHEVANHSYSHPQLSKMSDEAVKKELQRTHDAIVTGGGVVPKLMRPPYGAFTERQRRWCFGEFGYKCILWDVDPLDWKVRNSAHVQSEILKQTVAGSIVLSHDIHKSTVDAMPATLDGLIAKGFKFVTVSELLAMDRPVQPKTKGPSKAPETGKPATAPATSTTQTEEAPHPAPVTPTGSTPPATTTSTPVSPPAQAAAR